MASSFGRTAIFTILSFDVIVVTSLSGSHNVLRHLIADPVLELVMYWLEYSQVENIDASHHCAKEELEQIEKMEKASAACKETLNNVESRPDPLLPITKGPQNPLWDRWFEGPQEAQGCKCWIL
ncbi:hypothetical protein DITRI_Ditri15bG0087100 [Diplodiscus trichospermus]